MNAVSSGRMRCERADGWIKAGRLSYTASGGVSAVKRFCGDAERSQAHHVIALCIMERLGPKSLIDIPSDDK